MGFNVPRTRTACPHCGKLVSDWKPAWTNHAMTHQPGGHPQSRVVWKDGERQKCRTCSRLLRSINERPIPGVRTATLHGRGICKVCVDREKDRNDPRPDNFRVYRSRALFASEYQLLKMSGETPERIAARMGMTKRGLSQAVHRARKEGLL